MNSSDKTVKGQFSLKGIWGCVEKQLDALKWPWKKEKQYHHWKSLKYNKWWQIRWGFSHLKVSYFILRSFDHVRYLTLPVSEKNRFSKLCSNTREQD